MSVVTDESKRLFGCPECSRRFTRHENLRRHIGTSHQQEFHQCKYCVKQLKRLDLLKRHVKILHKDKFELDYGKSTVKRGSVKDKNNLPPVNQQSPASTCSDGSSGVEGGALSTISGGVTPVSSTISSSTIPSSALSALSMTGSAPLSTPGSTPAPNQTVSTISNIPPLQQPLGLSGPPPHVHYNQFGPTLAPVIQPPPLEPSPLYLPPFQAPDIPKSYDPKLHQYYSDLPFLPPKFLTHYKDIFCDRILGLFPVFDKRVFDEEKVAASFLRAIVSIGCVVTGLVTDRKLGQELWESGCSLIEVFLSDNLPDRFQLDWVQATVSLLLFNGLFSFDKVNENHIMIFKKLWICNPKLTRLNGISDIDSQYVLPCQYVYYVVNTFLVMFTQNKNWYLTLNDLDGYILELDKQMTLPEALAMLSKQPIILKEVASSSLLLLCGVYELLESDLKLQPVNDKEMFNTKLSRILENLVESISIYYTHIGNPNGIKDLDVFWCLWHSIHLRARVSKLFFEKPLGFNRIFLDSSGVNSPFETLKIELKSMKKSIEEKRLNHNEYWQSEYIKISPSFIWSVQQLKTRSKARTELPIERLIHIRIIFYGMILIQKLEQSNDEYERQFLKNLNDELKHFVDLSDGRLLSTGLFSFMKEHICGEGAWHIGGRLREILDEYNDRTNIVSI